jgi:hypothetical protein
MVRGPASARRAGAKEDMSDDGAAPSADVVKDKAPGVKETAVTSLTPTGGKEKGDSSIKMTGMASAAAYERDKDGLLTPEAMKIRSEAASKAIQEAGDVKKAIAERTKTPGLDTPKLNVPELSKSNLPTVGSGPGGLPTPDEMRKKLSGSLSVGGGSSGIGSGSPSGGGSGSGSGGGSASSSGGSGGTAAAGAKKG